MLQREVCHLSLIFTASKTPTFEDGVLLAVSEIKAVFYFLNDVHKKFNLFYQRSVKRC